MKAIGFFKLCKYMQSRVEICLTLMEISLNLMGFTDFFYKEMFNFIFLKEYFFTQPIT